MKPNLVYMYYTHFGYWTSVFGKNLVYYIHIFTVLQIVRWLSEQQQWNCSKYRYKHKNLCASKDGDN